jgi:two-component system chemotaxis sensor kinase CheA
VSVASRLALFIFALVAAVSAVIALELARRERGHYLESKRSAAEMLTELLAASVVPALDFDDAGAVARALATLLQNREVLDAAVWKLDAASPLAMLHAGGAPSLDRAEPGIQIADTYLDITRLVLSPTGARLGTVAVRVSLARENAAFGSVRRRIFWLASGLSALVAALLVAVVRRTIVTPLAELERAARGLAMGEPSLVLAERDDEVGRLGRTFNAMARAIAEREGRISNMNERLQGLLDNMRQAIVVFDADGALAEERSRLARQVFGDAAGPSNIAELLCPASSCSEVEREAFLAWLAELGAAPEAELDELFELAPPEVTLPGPDGERVLELEFRRAPSEGPRSRFMLLASDVTAQRRLERTAESQARAHEKQLTVLRRLLSGGAHVFVRFLTTTRRRLAQARALLDSTPLLENDALEDLFRFVHTLRGETRALDLDALEALAAELELALDGARHAPLESAARRAAREQMEAGLERLKEQLAGAEDLFVRNSPIGRRILEQVTVARQDVDELFQRFGDDSGDLGRLVTRLAARPFGELLAGLPEAVERWSRREGKRVELNVEGGEILVPPGLAEVLAGALAHLLRNAVAHGIEPAVERRARQKPEVGRIELACRESPRGISVSVADDGAGFDRDALLAAAAARGHVTADVFTAALLDGVSTRSVKDELGGFGVGLAAVHDDLLRAGYDARLTPGPLGGACVVIEAAPDAQKARHAAPDRLAEATYE